MLSTSDAKTDVTQLSASLREKEADIELLQQTFTEIGSELDLDNVFKIVSIRARELINSETLVIPILDDNLESYTYRGGAGKNIDEIVGESLPIDFGVCGWVWKHKKPWWKGMYGDLDEGERDRWRGEAGAIILVPLQGRRHFLGGIAGIGKTGGGEFDKRDLTLLQLFASIVSIAIENAMAVRGMEASKKLNIDYQRRLEAMNRRLVESSKELEYLSLYDKVTMLPNRKLFHDRLSQNISHAEDVGHKISLLLIDIDQFKKINEAFGHETGDILLKNIADRLRGGIQSNETIARLGGDEFIVILPKHDKNSAVERAKSLLAMLSKEFDIDRTEFIIKASIGIAIYPDQGDDASSLLKHADTAMYHAKSNSLGPCLYDQNMDYMARDRLTMVSDIRKAIEKNRFELYYQPKITLPEMAVSSAEALGRWTSKTWGTVPPNVFIEILEQIGLINDYTYWAIGIALEQARKWSSKTDVFRISVNISPHTLMDPEFIQELEHQVKDSENGQYLIFEITENLFLSEYEKLDEVLGCICSIGIKLSIDDYGTGYSSLSRLRKLPVAELKIDQSFVKGVGENTDDESIVRSTIDLAHNLGLSVVAEGVETKEALMLLSDLECDIAQGYYISVPLSAEEFDNYIKGHRS